MTQFSYNTIQLPYFTIDLPYLITQPTNRIRTEYLTVVSTLTVFIPSNVHFPHPLLLQRSNRIQPPSSHISLNMLQLQG